MPSALFENVENYMMFMKHGTIPGKYQVIVDVVPTKKNGLRKPFSSRVGGSKDLVGARKLIADDQNAMKSTYGGLIDAPGVGGRTYRVYECTYTEVKL